SWYVLSVLRGWQLRITAIKFCYRVFPKFSLSLHF
ncbi:unnamed protein product, partial [Tenebrio molitor]